MKKYKYLTLVIVETIFLIIIVILGFKIKELSESRIKGAFVTRINKDNVEFSSGSGNLKYFYEPKPKAIQSWETEWLGYKVENTINSDGLNERFEYSTQKLDNTFRILTLGDSFTFGQYVNTQDNYSEILEDLLNTKLHCKNFTHFQVINFGVYGYDIEYEVERLRTKGLKYNPDLVIWMISTGNFHKINEEVIPLSKNLEKNGVKGFNPITKRYVPLTLAIEEVQKKLTFPYLVSYQSEKMKKMNSIYQNKLLLLNHNKINSSVRKIIKDFINLNDNYTFVEDLFPFLDDHSFKLEDNHPNMKGHRKMAETLFSYLSQNTLKNCFISL